ncbi:MAG: translation initiation factor Sui1 [Acidobacteria bacterium]|nr:translation initiation factor Sui1 [Acidobacteriota bacterium]
MASKLVWTSDPEKARELREAGTMEERSDAPAEKQTIRMALDKKRRAGKTVTVASGFQLTLPSLSSLATQLKKRCGTGGTAKDDEIELQGDHLLTMSEELRKLGYRVKAERNGK